MILAGDVGGTNTRLALFEAGRGRLRVRHERTFPSREQTSLEGALTEFLSSRQVRLTAASLGIAGPVLGGRCEATNLPWDVDARSLARLLRLRRVGLINDLAANGYGISALRGRDFVILNAGARGATGNRAVISAGTGLGEAGMFWDGREHRPFATEGGHADFAPRTDLEVGLLEFLRKRHGRVSFERIVSGPGLVAAYEFLRDTGKGKEQPWLTAQLRQGDRAAIISQNALLGKSALCGLALDLFVSLYGSEAGNLALKFLATGGVYLGGGIAPRIVAKLREPAFMNAFTAKGRLRPLLQRIPVRVIMNPKSALLGAARHAALGLTD